MDRPWANAETSASPSAALHGSGYERIVADPPLSSEGQLRKEENPHGGSLSERIRALTPWRNFVFHRRYILLLLCALNAVVSYADRTNIAIAIIAMAQEFGWSSSTSGFVLSSFFYGYMGTQIVGGYLAYRFGGKPMLAISCALWSLFTALTPLAAHNMTTLTLCRICLGLSEGMGFPSIMAMISAHIPPEEHSRSIGFVLSGSYMGAVLANLVAGPLIEAPGMGWPAVFYIFGAVGLLWLIPWLLFTADPLPASAFQSVPTHEQQQKRVNSDVEELGKYLPEEPRSPVRRSIGTRHQKYRQSAGSSEDIVMLEMVDLQRGDSPPALEMNSREREEIRGRTGLDEDYNDSVALHVPARKKPRHAGSSVYMAQVSHPPKQRMSTHNSDQNIFVTSPTVSPHADVSAGLLSKQIPWRKILTTREVWAIICVQFCQSWSFWLIINWLPTYYKDVFQIDIKHLGYFTVIPYLCQGLFGNTAGFISDYMINEMRLRKVVVRKLMQCGGMLSMSFFMMLAVLVARTAFEGMVYITFATSLYNLTFAGVSVNHLDIAPKYAPVVYGVGNTSAQIPGIVGVWFTGLLLDWTGNNWVIVFSLAGSISVLGCILWVWLCGADVVIDD